MLSYQHGYHAGGKADVHKHAALAVIVDKLTQKPKPLSYMETHSGRGVYNLTAPEALKTGEAQGGILSLFAQAGPPLGHPYTRALDAARYAFGADFYPGSPLIARTLLRPGDHLHLMELHPQEHAALRRTLREDNVHIHKREGFAGVLAISPPTPRRGLVLIDPSYEVKSEYVESAQFIIALHKKWPQAVILLWYPILWDERHEDMIDLLTDADLPKFQRREIHFPALKDSHALIGSGLIFINTPYGVDEALDEAEDLLAPLKTTACP